MMGSKNHLTVQELALYPNCPCLIIEKNQSGEEIITPHRIEGVDFVLEQVICERANWNTSQIKLVLRPLESMTDTEATECYELIHKCKPKDTEYDTYCYITAELEDHCSAEVWMWAIRKQFDIFGWIEKGLALDTTKNLATWK